jgi:hypothetical protein
MGNSFIGFPVPRAKIADMIAGAAPPLIHHTDHENGGDDEVDCTGLAGAGGGLGFDDYLFETFFEAIDGYYIDKPGAEVCEVDKNDLEIDLLSTANSYVTLTKDVDRQNPVMTWDKERRLRFAIWAKSYTDKFGDFDMILAYDADTGNHIGFLIRDGVLKGSVGNGSAQTTVDLYTIGVSTWTYAKRLELHHYPNTRVDFYIDDVLTGTIDTPSLLPSGINYADVLLRIAVKNNAHAKQLKFRVSQWKLWQAP